MSTQSKPLAVVIPIANGSEPQILEIEDCTEVYGDNVVDLFPEVFIDCENPDAPSGQCHYNPASLEPTRCLYCGKLTG